MIVRHHFVEAAGLATADLADRRTPSPAADPRIYRGEAIRDLYPEPGLRDELLAWSLIVFAGIGLLVVCGYAWTVLERFAWA